MLWSNISAMGVSGMKDSRTATATKPVVVKLGYRAARVIIAQQNTVTVGLMAKACEYKVPLDDLGVR
jgi:hypothetical protein